MVQFTVILKGGMLLDNKDKVGTAYLTAKMLGEGTKNRSAIELREATQDLGATINVTAGSESILLTGTCMAGKLDATIALAREMLLEPRWDEKEFSLLKSQTRENLKRMETMPSTIASNVFSKLLYGKDCILASVPMGSLKSIESITVDDLKKYHAANFSPTVAKVMMVGDVSQEKALAVLEVFKDWPAKEVVMPEMKVSDVAKPGIYFVNVPMAQQSQFRVGHLLPSQRSGLLQDRGHESQVGRRFQRHPEHDPARGKGIYLWRPLRVHGVFLSRVFHRRDQRADERSLETAQIIRAELIKHREGIDNGALDMVKSTLLKGNALKFETLNAISQMLLPVVLYDLPFTFIKDNEAIVQKITPAEHSQLAQKYLQPEKMIYLIVGDKATQFDKLQELGLGAPVLLDRDANPVAN